MVRLSSGWWYGRRLRLVKCIELLLLALYGGVDELC